MLQIIFILFNIFSVGNNKSLEPTAKKTLRLSLPLGKYAFPGFYELTTLLVF